MDLHARTLDTLDWQVVLDRLARHARTPRGAQAAMQAPLAQHRSQVEAWHAQLLEVRTLEDTGERMPVGAIGDVSGLTQDAHHGRTLEVLELAQVADTLRAMDTLRLWLQDRLEQAPALNVPGARLELDPELVEDMVDSFDDKGQLSEEMYPELGELRERIQSIHRRIRSTLDELLRDPAMGPLLQDRFVTQRGDRYVLPIKADFKRKNLGIVHDTSGSGETVFVEPAQVVELNNNLRLAEAELERAIVRILTQLSTLLALHAEPVLEALDAATEIDLACARSGLGEELGGWVPEMGRGGVIDLKQARHPVLALRGIDVVPNDLTLDADTRGLVLSGPNTGGKTVALKTLGLAALFCRAGLPFPALEGSRIDLFPQVVADIGDLQSVEGDLSTFSGHLLVLQQILEAAAPGTLVLLDEVAVGTDPAQGAALARAVLEQVVEQGARLAITTHYNDLKAFAAADPRFRNAAMHLLDGQPTYQLELDAVGLSHAFATARRLGLDEGLIDRAESYVEAEVRQVGRLLEELEQERVKAEALRQELDEQLRINRRRERDLDKQWNRVRQKADKLAERKSAQALERIERAEDQVRSLVAELQRNPDLKLAGRSLEQIRKQRAGLAPEPPKPVEAPPPPRPLQVGDRVRMVRVGRVGTVLSIRKDRLEVDVGGLKMKARLKEVQLIDNQPASQAASAPHTPAPRPKTRVVDDVAAGNVRTDRNTCDLRGKRADAAVQEVDLFLDRMLRSGESVGWILHGHGSGALKQAVRQWLPKQPHVASWRAANEDEGGDAFTRVQV